jgi:hypothetical protein
MRQTHKRQCVIEDIPIKDIEIDITSRDDIPPLLLGLQQIYANDETRNQLFSILENEINPSPEDPNANMGRPGMTLWRIFVLGVLRLCLNCDYDRLQELANHHDTIKLMLEHGILDSDYKLQTIKDNVSLLTPEIMEKINQVIVEEGHKFVLHEEHELLRGRCDSFVVETNVSFPTDVKLLGDAMRKVITLLFQLCSMYGMSDWKQWKYNLRQIKEVARAIQKMKRSKSKDEAKAEKQNQKIMEAYQDYINIVQLLINKAIETLNKFDFSDLITVSSIAKIRMYLDFAMLEVEQIRRRVIEGEKIPNDEKIFSIFEEHTEWISKGKAGVPVELGLKVCVLEDQYGFILNHKVMQNETDDQIVIGIIEETQNRFPGLRSCSFDKGFYSPSNLIELSEKLDVAILPKKGKLSEKDKERQSSTEFSEGRRQHSAVESAINCLEVHGLDKCPDRGLKRFYSYISIAVVSRNLHQLGLKIRNNRRKEQHQTEEFQSKAA